MSDRRGQRGLTYGHDSRGRPHSDPDYRELVGRLSFGAKTARNIAFSPNESWVLTKHIQHLAQLARLEGADV